MSSILCKHTLHFLTVLLTLSASSSGVQSVNTAGPNANPNQRQTPINEDGSVMEDAFKQCLVTRPANNLGYCLGYGALNKLQSFENDPQFDVVDGVTYARDEKMFRDGYSVLEDRDPSDYRGILDSVGQVFSRRSMHWDMGFLYPGLGMRVAPSITPGGVLEFVMDPQHDAISVHALKEVSTGRILARQFLVPFLLGFKFNIATLIPIIFGILALIAKKALFFSKLALILSSSLALGSLVFPGLTGLSGGHSGGFNPGFGGGLGGGGGGGGSHNFVPYHNRFPEETEYVANHDSFFRGNEKAANNLNVNVYPEDQLRLYGDLALQEAYANSREEKGRNFAWNDNDKKKKI